MSRPGVRLRCQAQSVENLPPTRVEVFSPTKDFRKHGTVELPRALRIKCLTWRKRTAPNQGTRVPRTRPGPFWVERAGLVKRGSINRRLQYEKVSTSGGIVIRSWRATPRIRNQARRRRRGTDPHSLHR